MHMIHQQKTVADPKKQGDHYQQLSSCADNTLKEDTIINFSEQSHKTSSAPFHAASTILLQHYIF